MSPWPIRDGFLSQTVLMPSEEPSAYQFMFGVLMDLYSPVTADEDRQVREMANAEWRLRRSRVHQERMLARTIEELAAAQPDQNPIDLEIAAHEALLKDSAYFRHLVRFETKFERDYDRARKAAENSHRERQSAPMDPPVQSLKPPQPATGPNEARNATNAPSTASRTPRNSLCPCGSGEKYKRCCGRGAPPVLGRRAA